MRFDVKNQTMSRGIRGLCAHIFNQRTPAQFYQTTRFLSCFLHSCQKFTSPDKNKHTRSSQIISSVPSPAKFCSAALKMSQDTVFRQLFEHKSFTYTYLIACSKTKEAVLIDPVYEMVARDERLINQLGYKLKYCMNTHVHADHITGSGKLKQIFSDCQSVLGSKSGAKADIYLNHGETIRIGEIKLEAKSTPGHTDGCMSYIWHAGRRVFTGDAVLIRGCGRTDFQQGSADRLYDSVHNNIFILPDDYQIFPAHDYTGQPWTTVGEEKFHNPRLSKPKPEFIEIMKNLNLPYPKQIDRALPANLVCGVFDEADLPPAK